MIPQPGDEWALRSEQVVTPIGIGPAAVLVRGEKIVDVVGASKIPANVPTVDVGEKMLLPGLVDTHVHINEPGRTDWEGFETATRAAAAGGVTTLIDMPLNCNPVTTSADALDLKRKAAEGQLWVDVGFHGGIVPGNAKHVQPMIDAGVFAFKAFLCPSGIDEFPASAEADLRQVMPILAQAGVPLFVHAEIVSPLRPEVEADFVENPKDYRAYLATRPPVWEADAIRLMIELCRATGCQVHIVHLSAAEAAKPLIQKAKAEGLPLTIETCPHYLNFSAEEIPNSCTIFKCAPPIRGHDQNEQLKMLVANGLIDTIGSDHSPAPPELKHIADGDLARAWGGIASLQLLLPATWSALANHCSPKRVIDLLTARPAALVGLGDRKGALAPGYDADLVVFDPETEFAVAEDRLHHRHKATPYAGHKLQGKVEATFLRGRLVYDNGRFVSGPEGQWLRRSASAIRNKS